MLSGLLWFILIVAGLTSWWKEWASVVLNGHPVYLMLSYQNVFIDTRYFFKALYFVRDSEITVSLLHVFSETFQILFTSWNLAIAFKQFYKYAKPVVVCGPLFKSGIYWSKFIQIDLKGTLKIIFIATHHWWHWEVVGTSSLYELVWKWTGASFYLVALHSHKLFFKRSRG